MSAVLLAILAPLLAGAIALLTRRGAALILFAGALVGTTAAVIASLKEPGELLLPGLPELPLRLSLTPLSAVLAVLVGAISTCVAAYAIGYMRERSGQPRFFAELGFFVAAMQTLIFAGDWVLLIAAWELIGFASYLLIGFEHEMPSSGASANRAFVITRGADLALYLGGFLLISRGGTSAILPTLQASGPVATLAGVLLLVGAMGKSAQLPFQNWLRGAMVAPTPVSALLHSATLVAAGAVLLVRIAPMLTPTALLITGLVGGLTAVVTGLVALAEDDLKRLLASSTSSQLGFMLLAVGAGSRGAALIHLLAHAAMKSALFMGAGSFQHARGGTAFEKLAGVGRRHRWTFAALVVSGLALAEAPPLAGFWSKEGIIAACFEGPSAWVFAPLALLGTALTGGYVARTLRLLWRGDGSGEPVPGLRWMGLGLAVLTTLVLGGGPALRSIAFRVGMPVPPVALDASLVVGLFAAAVGLWAGSVRRQWLNAPRLTEWAREGLPVRGGFDGWVVRPTLSIAGAVSTLDAKIHEGVRGLGRAAVALASRVARFDNEAIASGVTRIAGVVRRSGQRVRGWQSGLVFRELLLASVGIAVLLVWMTAWLLVRS